MQSAANQPEAIDLEDLPAEIERGAFPPALYSDPRLFALERDRVFGRAWTFLAHESEIPTPGDYVVRRILDDSFIVVRDEDGHVRVLLNVCLHRGMQLCRAELGNASHFRCPYHGWSYKNDGRLVGVPFHREAYGGDAGLRRADKALVRPAQVDTYKGLIFASKDPGAPPMAEYLGDFRYYLDFYTGQSADGIELRGPQRWRVPVNWKIGAENFCGDSYHTPHTHRSVVEIELFGEPEGRKRKEGALYFSHVGGGTTYKLPPGTFEERLAYVGYPPEMVGSMREVWTADQQALIGGVGFMPSAASVFPNLSLVHNWPQVNPDGLVVPFISLRLWQPVTSTETEVYSWFAVDRHAPEWFKKASYKAYIMCFGSSGMFEQDDIENWSSITAMSKAGLAQGLDLESGMGLDRRGSLLHDPLADWPGPGRAFAGYGEYNQRSLIGLWADYMSTAARDSSSTT